LRARIKAFKLSCEDRLVQSRLVRATLVPERNLYETGDAINLKLVLENLTAEPMEIVMVNVTSRTPDEETRRRTLETLHGLLSLEITYTEYEPFGSAGSITRPEYHMVDADIKLPPGGRWMTHFTMSTQDVRPGGTVFRTYELSGELRSFEIKVGARSNLRPVRIEPLTIPVYPVKVSRYLDDPLGSLARALDRNDPNEVFLVSLLIPEALRRPAVELLMAGFDRVDAGGRMLLMSCLRQVTRQPIELEESAWRRWWAVQQDSSAPIAAPALPTGMSPSQATPPAPTETIGAPRPRTDERDARPRDRGR
ncbi:MAG: hypothetical protein HZA54_17900, partial [Planctomycetes bacterium]|nr:hypothetical protein [Planctomycetota bacterium]